MVIDLLINGTLIILGLNIANQKMQHFVLSVGISVRIMATLKKLSQKMVSQIFAKDRGGWVGEHSKSKDHITASHLYLERMATTESVASKVSSLHRT